MSATIRAHAERIYAGVLGKMVGVYLGRPVEGWSYPDIEARFGEIRYYVHDQLDLPLVVADDDLSGTFAFFRALEDNDYDPDLSARAIGDTWLNYIIEGKTILWWGGLGRSTEHTAFLRLRAGIPAPRSGSVELNGRTLSEQIGAQIFIDAFAMAHPGDPDRAVALVREAASVSHDGVAVDAACFLGVMEALAFDVSKVEDLIDGCRRYVSSPVLHRTIDDVVAVCDREHDWRAVRLWLDANYGADRYCGPCHIVPNHAMVLASLILGGDSFQRSVMIATSAAWDTDCNAGNVGCLNGIRLGLDAISADVDFRAPLADRLLVVTADGGACVTDAVQEANRVVRAAARLRGEDVDVPTSRFTFGHRGSTQGFEPCPYLQAPYPTLALDAEHDGSGLVLGCHGVGPGVPGAVSTPVFIDRSGHRDAYLMVASPTLYPGQVVRLRARSDDPALAVRMYVLHRDGDGRVQARLGDPHHLAADARTVTWRVPDVGVNPLLRFGIRVESERRCDGQVVVEEIDWAGAPELFEQRGSLLSSPLETRPEPVTAWVSSAETFEGDLRYTYAISHPEGCGLATIGTRDWRDYSLDSRLVFNLHRSAGLVARSAGHRRYYAGVFENGARVALGEAARR